MSDSSLQPVILSGGSGSRLWSASRAMYPKQLLPLVSGESTMLQDTASRLDGLVDLAGGCIVVCNDAHRFLVAEQLRKIDVSASIVLEPEGRNTAPAIALAAFLALANDTDVMLLVMPADHVIRDRGAFQGAVRRGVSAAVTGNLVTFGIVPTAPETGYGYIQAHVDGDAPVPIAAFVEKPDLDTAAAYVSGGEHFWSSGMFLFRADAFLDALKNLEPEMYTACQASIENRVEIEDFIRPDADAFLCSPGNSIDYAVMEKTDKAVMVPLDAGRSDVGSWAALQDVRSRGPDDNTVDGRRDAGLQRELHSGRGAATTASRTDRVSR